MRVTKSKIGLRRWGGAHYRGVAELMLERLGSGPMDLDELADELAERYEISPASVRMYAAAPAFKVTGEVIALRSQRDPYVPRDKPWKVRGLYRQPGVPMTVWCIAVDNDMLRGSGRSIPQEIASDLGLGSGDRTELTTAAGMIPVAWSETSHSGPQIGSIRELVVHAGASVGWPKPLARRLRIWLRRWRREATLKLLPWSAACPSKQVNPLRVMPTSHRTGPQAGERRTTRFLRPAASLAVALRFRPMVASQGPRARAAMSTPCKPILDPIPTKRPSNMNTSVPWPTPWFRCARSATIPPP